MFEIFCCSSVLREREREREIERERRERERELYGGDRKNKIIRINFGKQILREGKH